MILSTIGGTVCPERPATAVDRPEGRRRTHPPVAVRQERSASKILRTRPVTAVDRPDVILFIDLLI